MKTKFFRNNNQRRTILSPEGHLSGRAATLSRVARLSCLLLLLTAAFCATAQNGVTVSGLVINAGTATFNVSWDKNNVPPVWSDTVWVFVDYNKNGVMTRLPLRAGATLTAHTAPDDVGKVIEVPGNTDGVWVVGNARSKGNFSATVKLLTAAAPAVSPGACAYASNYPPVGRYTTATSVSFTGTPMYKIVLKETGGTGILTEYSDGSYTIRAGYAIQSFTDATGAPGTFHCAMPTVQTLRASAAGYCEGATAVRLALSSTQNGVVYQLYRDNVPVSGATLNGTGSAATWSGTFAAGVYRAEALAGATCPAAMSGTHTIALYPKPAPPTITGPAQACNSATLVAVPGDHGNGIKWNNNSTAPVRTLTATTTCAAIATSPYGCTSATTTFTCTIRTPAAAGSAPDPLCCCSCGLTVNDQKCSAPAQSAAVPAYQSCTYSSTSTTPATIWGPEHLAMYCPTTKDCSGVAVVRWAHSTTGSCSTYIGDGNYAYGTYTIYHWRVATCSDAACYKQVFSTVSHDDFATCHLPTTAAILSRCWK